MTPEFRPARSTAPLSDLLKRIVTPLQSRKVRLAMSLTVIAASSA